MSRERRGARSEAAFILAAFLRSFTSLIGSVRQLKTPRNTTPSQKPPFQALCLSLSLFFIIFMLLWQHWRFDWQALTPFSWGFVCFDSSGCGKQKKANTFTWRRGAFLSDCEDFGSKTRSTALRKTLTLALVVWLMEPDKINFLVLQDQEVKTLIFQTVWRCFLTKRIKNRSAEVFCNEKRIHFNEHLLPESNSECGSSLSTL